MNQKHTLLIFFLSSLLMMFTGCKKQPDTPSFHYEYFGMQKGRYVVYDVLDITHDADLAKHDTVRYQIKTVWGVDYIDNLGRNAREFNRYIRANPTDEWNFLDLWTGIIVDRKAELIEENQRKVKLVFSPTANKVWDANAYNVLGEQECYYEDIHKPAIVGGTSFDSTVIVEQADESNLIDTVRIYEQYAKGVGMIKSFYKKNNYQFTPEVDKGKEIYYTFESTGIE